MKRALCFMAVLAVMLSAGISEDFAVCYPQCVRYDIWQRCYVTHEDSSCGAICGDLTGDGICDGCQDRLFYVDADRDGHCDNRSNCSLQQETVCRENAPIHHRQSQGRHHGRGHKGIW